MEVDFRIKFFNDRVDVRLSDIIYDGKKFREGGHYFSQKMTNTTNIDGSYEEKLARLRNLIGV